MKLTQLKEVRYAGSLEADPVLYTLWEKRNEIEKDNLSVVKIDDPALSKKRATAIVRYTVRVIVPEALDGVGMTDQAQTLRDLPHDVDLDRAYDAARAAITAHTATNDAAVDAADYAADAAYNVTYNADGGAAARAAARAANYTSRAAGNKQRHLYHLNQMIKIAADIK